MKKTNKIQPSKKELSEKEEDIPSGFYFFPVLKEPHITEKSSSKSNQYVFKVWPRTNKILVKREIEDVYGVKVKKVRIINIHSKKRKLGARQGYKPGYKKAIVMVEAGQKIEILPK